MNNSDLMSRVLRVYRVNGPKETTRRVVRKIRSVAAGSMFDEVEVLQELLTSRTANGVMVDVGAQRGNTLVGFLDAGWEVHAFEPDPVNLEELRSRFGSEARLTIHGVALSDKASEAQVLFGSKSSTGISGLLDFDESHEPVAEVEVATMKSVVEDYSIGEIDFLKVDTEGHDLAVLRGVDLSQNRPRVIFAEFDEIKVASGGHSLADLEELLSQNGYSFFVSEWHPIVRYGGQHQWRQVCSNHMALADPTAWGNIVASQDENLLEELRSVVEPAGMRSIK